jgi:hypothetical protein
LFLIERFLIDPLTALLSAALAVGLLLLLGDLISTFVYHVPEHAFGRLHCRVHHEKKQTFRHYAVLSSHPLVMLDGLLGALPYLLLALLLWSLSPLGSAIGLLLGECHVIWRHTTKMGWKTPQWMGNICRFCCVVTPEAHWVHHENGAIAFGDIFTFFDKPAQQWLKILIQFKGRFKRSDRASKLKQSSLFKPNFNKPNFNKAEHQKLER